MPDREDSDHEEHRYQPPHSARHQIPTIKRYREEKEARKAAADQYGHDNEVDDTTAPSEPHEHAHTNGQAANETDNGNGQLASEDEDSETAVDTSQADATATDPRARRRELKKRKDERAEREVTDPVTHLPVRIHDLTSAALEETPENDEPFGTTVRTSTGPSNQRKSARQLRKEFDELQGSHDAMRTLFPPPSFDAMKEELISINKKGATAGLIGTAAIILISGGVERLFGGAALARAVANKLGASQWVVYVALWLTLSAITLGGIAFLVFGVRDWMAGKIDSLWDDEVWDANGQSTAVKANNHETETVSWLNSLLGSVWPLINPDLFTSLADTLEDVMQASLPRFVEMVSVNDIGQGSENIRILGVRWLPSGAAAQSVSEDGKFKKSNDGESNDRKVSGEGQVDQASADQTEQAEDGSQQRVAEGLEAEEGDFVNVEIALAYRARSSKKSIKDRAKDMHLYMAFYGPSNVKV
jgi:hypothetical protein